MSAFSRFKRLPVVAAAASMMLVMAACAIQLRGDGDEAASNSVDPQTTGALADSLARCRTVTPDDTVVLEACRRTWAENRQHFFASTKSSQLPDPPANAPAGLMKSQDRFLPGEIEQNGTR